VSMRLDKFTQEPESHARNNWLKNKDRIQLKTEQDAIWAMRLFYVYRGKFPDNRDQFDEFGDEVGISTNATYIKKSTGITYTEAIEKAGADKSEVNVATHDGYDEWEAYFHTLICANRNGVDFTQSQLDSDKSLMTRKHVEDLTDMKMNSVKDLLGLEKNLNYDLNKENVIEQLNDCFNDSEDITKAKLNNRCSFSAGLVQKRFGNGSFINGLDKLGFDYSTIQESISKGNKVHNSNYSKAKSLTKDFDYDEEADGFVYLLECIDGNVSHYYVGNIKEKQTITNRLISHIQRGGDFTIFKRVDGNYTKIDRYSFNWDIRLKAVHEIYKDINETSEEFSERVDGLEWKKYQHAIESLDGNVYGGK